MRAGFSYQPIDALLISLEIEKDLDFDERIGIGLEYRFYKQFYIRTGFQTDPFWASFGLGFRPGKIKVDYAYGTNSGLGDIHELSVAYSFQNKL